MPLWEIIARGVYPEEEGQGWELNPRPPVKYLFHG